MKSFFVFDVESIGLHGQGYAVGGGVYLENGAAQWEFRFACPVAECAGSDDGLKWVKENAPLITETHRSPKAMRDSFWVEWKKAKEQGAIMVADCGWPVESRFLAECIDDDSVDRSWDGPYPLHEIASYLAAAGLDPLAKHERTASEMPVHDPLADARQSARMLSIAIAALTA